MHSQLCFTVFFEEGHWRALAERRYDGLLSIASHVFAGEPSEAELYQWWIRYGGQLRFSVPVEEPSPARSPSASRSARIRQAARTLGKEPVTEQIRAAAQAERKRRRFSAKKQARGIRLRNEAEMHEKKKEKRRKKKLGH
jgi:hypothetical protein